MIIDERSGITVWYRCKAKTILDLIHPEAAGAGGEEDVIRDNVFAAKTRLLESLEVLHEVTDSKVRWMALAVVAVLFGRWKSATSGVGMFSQR